MRTLTKHGVTAPTTWAVHGPVSTASMRGRRGVVAGAMSAAEYYKSQPTPRLASDGSVVHVADDGPNAQGVAAAATPPSTPYRVWPTKRVSHPAGRVSPDFSWDSGNDSDREGDTGPLAASEARVARASGSGSGALAEAPEKVHVQFSVPQYCTSFGQVLKVVGALEELGAWVPEKAPAMRWHEGHTWTLDVELPVGNVSFKVVMQDEGGAMRWEDGLDRTVNIPAITEVATGAPSGAGSAPVSNVGVACPWGDTQFTRVSAQPDREFLRRQLQAVEARVEALRQKRQRAAERRVAAALLASRVGAPRAALTAGVAPISASSNGGQVQVPLLDPSQLARITMRQPSSGVTAEDDVEPRLGRLMDDTASEEQRGQLSRPRTPALSDVQRAAAYYDSISVQTSPNDSPSASPDSLSSSNSMISLSSFEEAVVAGSWGLDSSTTVTPLPESLSERVLGATVDHLLAATHAALDREGPPPAAVAMGVAECEARRAAAFLGELQAAAAALEQEAGLAPGSSNGELLSGTEAAGSVPGVLQQPLSPQGPAQITMTITPAPGASSSDEARQRWQSVVRRVLDEVVALDDGTLVFRADSLRSADIDPQQMLMAALERARSRGPAPASHPVIVIEEEEQEEDEQQQQHTAEIETDGRQESHGHGNATPPAPAAGAAESMASHAAPPRSGAVPKLSTIRPQAPTSASLSTRRGLAETAPAPLPPAAVAEGVSSTVVQAAAAIPAASAVQLQPQEVSQLQARIEAKAATRRALAAKDAVIEAAATQTISQIDAPSSKQHEAAVATTASAVAANVAHTGEPCATANPVTPTHEKLPEPEAFVRKDATMEPTEAPADSRKALVAARAAVLAAIAASMHSVGKPPSKAAR